MGQATFSVRMDETLKTEFETLCNYFGMNMNTAFNVFARAVVRERRIPFEISSPDTVVTRTKALETLQKLRQQAKENGVADMSLDDVNQEIAKARREAAE